MSAADVAARIAAHAEAHGRAAVANRRPFEAVPKRLWARLAARAGVGDGARWADCRGATLDALAASCTRVELPFDGKDANKDEFVSAGGVARTDVDFRTYESKKAPGLFVTGELLDVDGVRRPASLPLFFFDVAPRKKERRRLRAGSTSCTAGARATSPGRTPPREAGWGRSAAGGGELESERGSVAAGEGARLE